MSKKSLYLRAALAALGLASLGIFVLWISGTAGNAGISGGEHALAGAGAAAQAAAGSAAQAGQAAEPALPDENRFVPIAENGKLALYADPVTAHFYVVSRSSGNRWRSYPNPEHWEKETITGNWRNNLLSPIMAEYIDASHSKSQSKLTNWLEEGGAIEGFEAVEGGYRAVFRFARTAFVIPIEVKLDGDYVETTIRDEGIREGALSLLNLKLFPMFGAEPSIGQEGYLFIPDGSGALIRFREQPATSGKPIYKEPFYGPDIAYYNEPTSRSEVKMPVFGSKSGEQGFVAVVTAGESYAKAFASPAGSLGISNWITAEWQYRTKFYQATNKQGTAGFYTFGKDRFAAEERTTRYYPLEGEAGDYAGMAAAYRSYLMERYGLQRIESVSEHIPMYVDIVGADTKEGFLWDDYITGTTTEQAASLLERLRKAGIGNLTVHYAGWQRWGYSSFGGLFPVDKRIGGSSGMKRFIEAAHKLDAKVYLEANYSLNNSGRGGYWARNDGLRNLSGTLQNVRNRLDREDISIVSPLYAVKQARADLKDYAALGADGILFTGGIGSGSYSDYNSRNRADRGEVTAAQQALLAEAKAALGGAAVTDGSFYALSGANHLHRLADDYSYDLFVDEAVPFAQIALHGLVTYSSEWGNVDGGSREQFLLGIEQGAYPSYVFTDTPSGRFKNAYSVWYYSMHAGDWEEQAAKRYARWNEALGPVQNQFIKEHAQLAPGVKKTVYENGHAVIVNYNEQPYAASGIRVPAMDFIVTRGGDGA